MRLPHHALLLLLLAAAAALAPASAAEQPGGGSALTPDQVDKHAGTVSPGSKDVYLVQPPEGTNPAITVTMTPLDAGGDVDLFCARGMAEPSSDVADFSSEAIGINQDIVYIPPVDSIDSGTPVYKCAVENPSLTRAAVSYRLEIMYTFNNTSLNTEEQAAAKELFKRCCAPDAACWDWKLANDRAASAAGVPASELASHTVVDGDLCKLGGVCSGGHLTQLNARGWYMKCEFPGDLFARFPMLRALYLSWNDLTGSLRSAATSLASLPLEELGLFSNQLSGQLNDMCGLVQQGTLEMVQLGGGNSLLGTLPACLFDEKSVLNYFSASGSGAKTAPLLTGPIPDAFSPDSKLQMLDLNGNNLTGPIPPSLAALPNLWRLTAANNSLTGTIPPFASRELSVLALDFNNLTGTVPDELLQSPSLIRISVDGNPQLTQPPAAPSPDGGSSAAGLDAAAIAGICVGAVFAVVLVAGVAALAVGRRRRGRGARTTASNLKFEKFLDDAEAATAAEAGSHSLPQGAPAAFYEAAPAPASAAPAGGVELSGRPAGSGTGSTTSV